MLKIKDSVNLKELEKFGFEYDEDNNYYFYYGFTRPDCNSEIRMYVDKYDRIITTGFDIYVAEDKIHDKIYDLIKAGLVEKVEEKDERN